MSVAAFANTDLDDTDRAIVGNASASPVALECGGDPENITLRVIADNGANNGTTAAERSVTAPTALTVTDSGLWGSATTQTQSFRDTSSGGNYSQNPDTLEFTIAVSADADAPAGLSSYAITFSETGAGMVNLGAKVDLNSEVGTAFTNPLLYVDITCASEYTTSGFFQPVDMVGWNKAKAGRTVPLKFDIIDADENPVEDRTDLVSLEKKFVSCSSVTGTGTYDIIETYATGGTELRWDDTAKQYIFNFATSSNWKDKCMAVTLYLDDDEAATAYFQFTK